MLAGGRRRSISASASSTARARRRPTTTFLVKPNTGVQEIADQLERRGLISDARIFRLGVRAYGNDGALKAGEYEIKAGASMHDIMELLKSGKSMLVFADHSRRADRRAGVRSASPSTRR